MQQPQGYMPGATVSKQVEYKSRGAMEKGNAQMARQGYRVQSVTELQQRAGCGRILALGLFAAVFRPKPHYLVTYTLAA